MTREPDPWQHVAGYHLNADGKRIRYEHPDGTEAYVEAGLNEDEGELEYRPTLFTPNGEMHEHPPVFLDSDEALDWLVEQMEDYGIEVADDDYMSEHGYIEVYVPVWDGETNPPVNLTLDVVADEETINEMDSELFEALTTYGTEDGSGMQQAERVFADTLWDMLEAGIVMDAYCDEFGISNPHELAYELEAGEVETYPVY